MVSARGSGHAKPKQARGSSRRADTKFGMTLPTGIKACLDGYGVPSTVRRGSLDELRKLIDQDRPPIVLVRSGVKTWHYVVVAGYQDGDRFSLADPGSTDGKLSPISGTVLDGAWTFSQDLEGKAIVGRKCRVCGGEGKVAKGWTKCATCFGKGNVFGKKCKFCGGDGKWESGGAHCVACNGDGKEPDWFRKAVETAGVSGHTLIVPDRSRRASTKPVEPKPAGELISYTLRNDSGRTVHAVMQPSGKSYTFPPGFSGDYKSRREGGKAPTITIKETGRTYSLRSGTHRFWWMADKKAIGLDLADAK